MRVGLCPHQQMRPAEPSHSLRRVVSIFLPIVLALILLPVMAFASPPDPSWIAGIYDGADGDDIVNLVYETSAANVAAPTPIRSLLCRPGTPFQRTIRILPDSQFARAPRAPPISRSVVSPHVIRFPVRYTPKTAPAELHVLTLRSSDSELTSEEGPQVPGLVQTYQTSVSSQVQLLREIRAR